MFEKSLRTIPKLAIFLLLLAATHGAQAQTADRMVINIPFEFSAGGRQLPAGQYSVKRTMHTTAAFTLQRTDASAAAIVLASGTLSGGAEENRGSLVLRRYGHMYFLAEVWMPGRSTGSRVPESRPERRLRREVAAADGRPELVVLLAGRR